MPKLTHGRGGKTLSRTQRKPTPEFNPANQERRPRLAEVDVKFHPHPEMLSLEDVKVEISKANYWSSLEHDNSSEQIDIRDDIDDYFLKLAKRRCELLKQPKQKNDEQETAKKVLEPTTKTTKIPKKKKKTEKPPVLETVDPPPKTRSATKPKSPEKPAEEPVKGNNTNAVPETPPKTLKFLLRGLPVDFETTKISFELGKLNFEARKIIQFRRREGVTYRPLPLFLIIVPDSPTQVEILKLQELSGHHLSVEKFRGGRNTIQCFRCQKYGHTQRLCSSTPRCMKCADEHYSYLCRKSTDTPATCCNCGESHTSNFTGCKARPKKKWIRRNSGSPAQQLTNIFQQLLKIIHKKEVHQMLTTILEGINNEDN